MIGTNKCPVCGKTYLYEYEICPVCGWENDPIQMDKPDLEGGANRMSLNQAITAYKKGEKLNKKKLNEDVIVMASEPLKDYEFEDIQCLVHKTIETEALVNLYAAVFNEFFWVEDNEYDFPKGTPEYAEACRITDQWGALMDELEERLMRIASDAGLLLPREPNSGTVKQMGPFMKKYGFVNANGWWIKH